MPEIQNNVPVPIEDQMSPAETGESSPVPTVDDGAGHYAAYEEHARTLRTWLVTYGIGGPEPKWGNA